MITLKGKYTTATIMIDNVEDECIKQIQTFLDHPTFTNPVVMMPDTHAGKGSVIGFTMKLTKKVIPNIVGVDIGCGVLTVNSIQNPFQLRNKEQINEIITSIIKFGKETHIEAVIDFERDFNWDLVNRRVREAHINLIVGDIMKQPWSMPVYNFYSFKLKCKQIGIDHNYAINSIGSLGGGNHFIELGKSETTGYWITIHCGSRNFGLKIANYWQNIANNYDKKDKELLFKQKIAELLVECDTHEKKKFISKRIEQLKVDIFESEHKIQDNLQYLNENDSWEYLCDMILAQEYAKFNRWTILRRIFNSLHLDINRFTESVHNYIDFDDLIIRKGAVKSYKKSLLVIPFNMRDGLLICEGKSNNDWNCSAPHGAGRLMSRTKAKQSITLDQFQDSMKNVYSTSVCKETIDESPFAYKDTDTIKSLIESTCTIIDEIKPIINAKGL